MSTARAADTLRSFDASLPMALLKAREAAMRRFRPVLSRHDVSEQQWRVIRALADGSRPTVGELAETTFLLGPSLSRILSRLDEHGLITRQVLPDDQRSSIIALSAAGRQLFDRIAPESEAAYQSIEEAFGSTRLAALLAELAELSRLDDDEVPQ